MQFLTSPSLEGQSITEYCGVLIGEATPGANIFRDFFAGICDIVGGCSGADVVVGIDIDDETVGKDSSTAVKIRR